MKYLICFIFLAAQPALSQEKVGSAVVDGERVSLFSDGTWTFDSADTDTDTTCRNVAGAVSFCGNRTKWEPVQPANGDIAKQYRFDDRHYAMMIVEGLGSDDGMTTEFMRKTILQNAALATNQTAADIPILDTFTATVAGEDFDTIVYSLRVDGLPVVYSNTIVTRPRMTLQAISFGIGQSFTAQHADIHREFLSEVRIE